MKKSLFALAILAGFTTSSALAADLPSRAPPPVYVPPPPIFTWTGFYVGINGGGAFGRTDVFDFNVVGTTAHHDVGGGEVGGTAGYNYQIGQIVLGVEADADWADVRGSTACPAAAFTCGTHVDFLGSVRARAGLTWDRVLVYATGGLGLGDFRYSASPGPGFPTTAADTLFRAGYVGGGGVEYAITHNWSAKVEYLFYGFATSNGQPPLNSTNTVNLRTNVQTVKAGINYKFDAPPPPAPPVIAKY